MKIATNIPANSPILNKITQLFNQILGKSYVNFIPIVTKLATYTKDNAFVAYAKKSTNINLGSDGLFLIVYAEIVSGSYNIAAKIYDKNGKFLFSENLILPTFTNMYDRNIIFSNSDDLQSYITHQNFNEGKFEQETFSIIKDTFTELMSSVITAVVIVHCMWEKNKNIQPISSISKSNKVTAANLEVKNPKEKFATDNFVIYKNNKLELKEYVPLIMGNTYTYNNLKDDLSESNIIQNFENFVGIRKSAEQNYAESEIEKERHGINSGTYKTKFNNFEVLQIINCLTKIALPNIPTRFKSANIYIFSNDNKRVFVYSVSTKKVRNSTLNDIGIVNFQFLNKNTVLCIMAQKIKF